MRIRGSHSSVEWPPAVPAAREPTSSSRTARAPALGPCTSSTGTSSQRGGAAPYDGRLEGHREEHMGKGWQVKCSQGYCKFKGSYPSLVRAQEAIADHKAETQMRSLGAHQAVITISCV